MTELVKHHEKTPTKSKKFIGYMWADAGWKAALLFVLALIKVALKLEVDDGELAAVLTSLTTLGIAIVFVAGFVQVGYLLNQGSLDKFVRLAHIMHGKEENLESEEDDLELEDESSE